MLLSDTEEREISSTFTVKMCRTKLMNKYKTEICKVHIKPWEHTSRVDVQEIYTVVTMYKKDAHGQNIGEHEKVILEGSVNDIFQTKVNGVLPKRIVVFAAAGKGKTTAVAKMAYDWMNRTQGSPLRDVPLLFILKLRNIHPEASLGQAITSESLSEVADLSSEKLEKFIRKNQDMCWLILDGLDEYSGSLTPKEHTQCSNIARILNCLDLGDMRVLVTSRPHVEKAFMHKEIVNAYARMEIEGFSRDNSFEYIKKFFKNEEQEDALKKYLGQNDVINELVLTPLFCLMICYLWREKFLLGINTQTKLFDSVTQFLWHHVKSKDEKYDEKWLKITLNHLGMVALKGLLDNSNKLLFTCEDFQPYPQVINDGCNLGLISETNSFSWTPFQPQAKKTYIEFYHKLAQEHCAATYLARKHKKSNRLLVFLRQSPLDKVLRNKQENIGDYEHLVRFIGGRSNTACARVMGSILATSLPKREKYRILLDCSSELADISSSLSSIVGGCISGGSVDLVSPTIYTAIGIKNLPKSLKQKVNKLV